MFVNYEVMGLCCEHRFCRVTSLSCGPSITIGALQLLMCAASSCKLLVCAASSCE